MKKVLVIATEVGLVMFLLLTNVLMGFFTLEQKNHYSFQEKLLHTLTFENILISFIAGIISYITISAVRKR